MRIAYCVLRIAYYVLCWVAGSYFASHAPSITQYAIRNTQYASRFTQHALDGRGQADEAVVEGFEGQAEDGPAGAVVEAGDAAPLPAGAPGVVPGAATEQAAQEQAGRRFDGQEAATVDEGA